MLNRILFLLVVEIGVFIGTLARPFWGTLFLLLLVIIRPQDDRPNMQELHYPLVIMSAVLLSTLARQSQIQKRFGALLRCIAPFLAILALMWISGMANGYTEESSYQIGQYLSNIVLCSLLLTWIDSEERFVITAVTFLLAGLYFVRTVISDPRMTREEIGTQQFDRVFLRSLVNFGNPNYMALLMVLMIFIALSLFAVKFQGWKKVAVVGSLLGYIYVFLKCQSRGATLAFVAGFLVFWLLQKRKVLLGSVSLIAITVGLVFFAPAGYFARMGTITSYEQDASAMGRLEFWRISIGLIQSHPIVGIGPANFMHYATNSQHQSYLEMASETGIFGLLLYIFCLLRGLATAISARSLTSPRNKNLPVLRSFAGGVAACIVAIIVQGFFTGFSYREFVYMMLTFAFLIKDLAVRAEAHPAVPVSYAPVLAADSARS